MESFNEILVPRQGLKLQLELMDMQVGLFDPYSITPGIFCPNTLVNTKELENKEVIGSHNLPKVCCL